MIDQRLREFVEHMAQMSLPEEEFEAEGCETVGDYIANLDSERLEGEYNAFMTMVRLARELLKEVGGSKLDAILADTDASIAAISSYGYKLVMWQDFKEASDRPEGLLERALEVTADRPEDRCWVVYDPESDYEGWMLIGERAHVVRETVKDLVWLEPPEGPLSPKELN